MIRHFWHKVVDFDENVVYHEYAPLSPSGSTEIGEDYYLSARDRSRTEPRYPKASEHMASVQNLLEEVCPKNTLTIVYGNLGRYPTLVSYYLDHVYRHDQRVGVLVGGGAIDLTIHRNASPCWEILENNYPVEGEAQFDVLFWIEPPFGARIENVHFWRARSWIVLTSHLSFEIADRMRPFVVAHHVGDAQDLQRHLSSQPPLREYVEGWRMVDRGYDEIFVPDVFFAKHFEVGTQGSRRVCADLTACDSESEAYLRLLNARDAILYNSESRIENWSVALKEGVKDRLVKELLKLKETLSTKYRKIPCNLNGVNLMIQHYIDPFLLT